MAGAQDDGAVAQLGERCNGIAEVRGSIPLGSTIPKKPASLRAFLLVPGAHFGVFVFSAFRVRLSHAASRRLFLLRRRIRGEGGNPDLIGL